MRDRQSVEITILLTIGIVLTALIVCFIPRTPSCTDIKGIGGVRPLGLEIIIHCLARSMELATPPAVMPSPAPGQTSLPFPPNMPGGLPANARRQMQQTQVVPGPTVSPAPPRGRLSRTALRIPATADARDCAA
jgi:hypothetical protein